MGETETKNVVAEFRVPVRLTYTIRPGVALGRFLYHLKHGKLVGLRCPMSGKVYVPPRGPSPTAGVMMDEEVEVADCGIVTSFCVVNVAFEGQAMTIPYVGASILLDGADIPLFHVVGECSPKDVRMGMRVRAVWKPQDAWGYTTENIAYFRPTGEADAPLAAYREYL